MTMLSKLKELLKAEPSSERLTELKPDLQVAVCAILLEVAHADNDFDPAERETIVILLRERFQMDSEEVEQLIALTQEERERMPDIWPFTNAIGRVYTPEEKLTLLEMVWRVVYADEKLDAHEEMLVRKLQRMLSVNHSLVIEAKLKAKEGDS